MSSLLQNRESLRVPEPTLRRLPWYLSNVKLLKQKGERFVSSTQISKEINIDMENATIDISDGNIKINKEKAGIQLDLKALIDALFIEVNPVPVKTALNLLGFEVGHLRLPLGEMNPKNLEVLKQELINAGLDVKQTAELGVK